MEKQQSFVNQTSWLNSDDSTLENQQELTHMTRFLFCY
uniref:Uncharacterized protein n=1 Tax=Rhizophora mucronata TaxID=61149 RepID=A0A2P2QPQ5_RHIMU